MAAATPQRYRTLDPQEIGRTAERLSQRIAERFPGSGLSKVAAELVTMAQDLAEAASLQARPIWWPRILIGLVLAAGLMVLASASSIIRFDRIATGAFDFMQGVEASLNVLILFGFGLLFLWGLEERIKRRRIFRQLHGLRSLIHVIDMHQLTKDPSVVRGASRPTASSPKREMSEFELARYLDYCAEMLALIAKLAALYQRELPDPEIGAAVNDVESLASDLGRKIWQKITLIGQLTERPS